MENLEKNDSGILLICKLLYSQDISETCGGIYTFVIFLDSHSTKQGQPLADSWSRGLD